MDDGTMDPHNGWENKFTWLIHLHLSNEEHLMDEITRLVASEPNNGAAGRLVEMWVKLALTNWLTLLPGRHRKHDEEMRLLAWDLLGSALAYVDWVKLVEMLTGTAPTQANLFTMTLYHSVLGSSEFQQGIQAMLAEASSLYVAADAVKEWFEVQLDTWIETPAARQQQHAPLAILFQHLVENTYAGIFWEHVARAFQPEY